MTAEVSTSRTELEDSRVRVEVEVRPEALERELRRAAEQLGGDMKIPGFRKGKVPAPVVLQRLGRSAVLDEAVRDALPEWYGEALAEARVAPIGQPKLDLSELPDKGSPLSFSFEVGVVPKATLGRWQGLEVGRREPEVLREEVDAEVERVRESAAALENVDRPAAEGDFVVVDFTGSIDGEPFEGGDARGQLLELGAGRLIPGFEEQLVGASAEQEREVRVPFPDDYHAEHLAGREAVFAVSVREVKEKRLPDLDEDFAAGAGFDSVEELREDAESRLRDEREGSIEVEYRAAVLDAVAANATVELPSDLVHGKAHDMWSATARRLRAQGIDPARYLEATGKTEEDLAHDAEPDAELALRRESVLAAMVEEGGIEASDEDVLESLRESAAAHAASHGHAPPSDEELRESLEKAKEEGRDGELREDVTMRRAIDRMVEASIPIPAERAEAREKLWTPEDEASPEPAGELWTPGS